MRSGDVERLVQLSPGTRMRESVRIWYVFWGWCARMCRGRSTLLHIHWCVCWPSEGTYADGAWSYAYGQQNVVLLCFMCILSSLGKCMIFGDFDEW